jgi:hypothetical protein
MNPTVWSVAEISLTLPMEYKLEGEHSKQVPILMMIGISNEMVTEDYRHWVAPGGKTLTVISWTPCAPFPGQPLKWSKKWSTTIAGRSTIIYKISNGKEQAEFSTGLSLKSPDSDILISGNGVPKSEFEKILASISPSTKRLIPPH